MEGQWIGEVVGGDGSGRIIMDIDGQSGRFEGSARLFLAGEPGVVCPIIGQTGQARYILEGVPLSWMPVGEAILQTREAISERHPDTAFPATATIELRLHGDEALARWKTDLGRVGEATLRRSNPGSLSRLAPLANVRTWEEFKRFALTQEPGQFVFRGQSEAFPLRTAFHRTHRKDLIKYVAQDIPLAYKMLMARTRHLFDLSRPEQEAAFWNLIQHHGYPTPLLDWSQSPFVAAFFAYRRRQRPDAPSDQVRILAFDAGSWTRDFAQLQAVNFADLHFSILNAMAIENPRALPQQGLSTLTNVDDIEGYIATRERERGIQYLYAIDLPASSRREVMIELSLMGITAGSLFPGLDGACEELRGRMFHS